MPRHCTDDRRSAIYAAFPADRFDIDGPAVGLTPASLKGATRKDRIGLGLAVRMADYRPALSVEDYLGHTLPRVRFHREYRRADLMQVGAGILAHIDAHQRRAFTNALAQVCDEFGVPGGAAREAGE